MAEPVEAVRDEGEDEAGDPRRAARARQRPRQAEGAVAAPTAGLHVTPDVLAQLARKGIKTDYLTLHVPWTKETRHLIDALQAGTGDA